MQNKTEAHVSHNKYTNNIKLTYKAQVVLKAMNLNSLDYILLLPHDDKRFNASVRSAFTLKIGSRRGAVVEGRSALEIIALYSLYNFTNKIIIGSLDLPHGRKLRNLIESGIATEYELINDVILGALNEKMQ